MTGPVLSYYLAVVHLGKTNNRPGASDTYIVYYIFNSSILQLSDIVSPPVYCKSRLQFMLRPVGGLPAGPGQNQAPESGGAGGEVVSAQRSNPHPGSLQTHPADRRLPRSLQRHHPQLLQGSTGCEHFLCGLRENANPPGCGDDLSCDQSRLPSSYLTSTIVNLR